MTSKKLTTGLHVALEDLPLIRVQHSGSSGAGSVEFRMVYGETTGIMVADRAQGYHSKPHYHDCEQFNYVLDGELWFFVGKEGYLCRKGDIIRVPSNDIHWVWVTGEGGCTLLETHTAPLIGDPQLGGEAVAMIGEGENFASPEGVVNIFTDVEGLEEIEERAFARHGLARPSV